MSVVNIASRNLSEAGPDHLAELAVSLSGRLTRVLVDGMPAAIAESLAEIAAAIRVDGCRLYEFGDAGDAGAGPRTRRPGQHVDRRRRRRRSRKTGWCSGCGSGETVSISRPEDLPREAILSRQQARQVAPCSILGAPATSGRPGGLRAGRRRRPRCRAAGRRRWSSGCSCCRRSSPRRLQRGRHETALRANVTVIEQLNARLEADNGYLKEEIKSYHDFDDIVGESASLRAGAGAAVAGRADQLQRVAARTDRHRQGVVRARAARAQPPPRASAGARQLRGAAAVTGRERVVRPREGRLHRRGGAAAGPVRARRRRHDLPRRNRRSAARHPGEVPARAAGRRVRARRIVTHQDRGCARHRRDAHAISRPPSPPARSAPTSTIA